MKTEVILREGGQGDLTPKIEDLKPVITQNPYQAPPPNAITE